MREMPKLKPKTTHAQKKFHQIGVVQSRGLSQICEVIYYVKVFFYGFNFCQKYQNLQIKLIFHN